MKWNDLPVELRIKILKLHFDMREQSCLNIQKNWKKYIARIESAIDIALELEVDLDGVFNVLWPETSLILEYCARVISGKHHRGFWTFIVDQIQIGLHINEHTGGPSAIYYNRTEQACEKLSKKFNLGN